jgi:hypothetical protein
MTKFGVGIDDLGKARLEPHQFREDIVQGSELAASTVPALRQSEDFPLGNCRDQGAFVSGFQAVCPTKLLPRAVLPDPVDQRAGVQRDQVDRSDRHDNRSNAA